MVDVSHYYANYLSSENVTIMLMASLLCSVTINIKRNKIQIKTDKKQKNKTDKKQCRVKSHHQHKFNVYCIVALGRLQCNPSLSLLGCP